MNLWWKLFISGLAVGLVIGWWLASESYGQTDPARDHILIECLPGSPCVPIGPLLPKTACLVDMVSRIAARPAGTRLFCKPIRQWQGEL